MKTHRGGREEVQVQHTNTYCTTQTQVREGQTHLAHVTLASFSCSRNATCTALTVTQTRIRVAVPRVNTTPGLNPCNHLAWLACGPWRTHIQAWHGMVWYGMAWGCGLRYPPHPSTEERSSSSWGRRGGGCGGGGGKGGGGGMVVGGVGGKGGGGGVGVAGGRWSWAWKRRHQSVDSTQQRGLVGRRSPKSHPDHRAEFTPLSRPSNARP